MSKYERNIRPDINRKENEEKEKNYWLCDESKCKKCKYRMTISGGLIGCSYLLTENKRRKFDGHECLSFKSGQPPKAKEKKFKFN